MAGVVGEPRTFDVDSRFASDLTRDLHALRPHFRPAGRVPGLEVVYEPAPGGPQPLLDRLVVRFVQTLEVAVDLLRAGRLDVASLPSSVNLPSRLRERGLDAAVAPAAEVVYLDLRGSSLSRAERAALGAWSDARSLDAAFVRELGGPASSLDPGERGPFGRLSGRGVTGGGRRISLAAPIGDELLGLVQRALHDDWERHGFVVDVVTIDARTFYGGWADDPPVDVCLRRSRGAGSPGDRQAFGTMDAIPLLHVAHTIAWRRGVHGIRPDPEGPFTGAERWWIARR